MPNTFSRSIYSLKFLIPYIKPYAWLLLFACLLGIPLAAIRSSYPYLLQMFVDKVLNQGNQTLLKQFPLIIVGISIVNFLIRFPHYYSLRIVIARVNQRIKYRLYNHLMGLSSDYFTTNSTGSLISRVGHDPQYIDGGLSCINILIREPLTFLFLFGYALYLNWQLTLITVTIIPLLAVVFAITGKHFKRYINRMAEENAEVFARLQEHFSGIRVVKAFRLEKYANKKFRERVDEYTRFSLKTAALEEASHPAVELVTAIAVAGVIYFGGDQVVKGAMTPGGFTAFLFSFGLMMDPVRRLNDVNIKLSQAAGACERFNQILNWKSNLRESTDPKKISNFSESIRFERITFAYPDVPQRNVLENVSVEVKKGQVVALVGESGAGKSSFASLLPRLFDVTSGAIKIDGMDIRDLKLEDLRSMIAIVSQDVFLFNDTVEENIRCGRLDATREEIQEAAEMAYATEFIDRLPNKFKTVIGDRGQKLSGGERQRLSIARAFLRKAPILILDEATSSLDAASEKMVQKALSKLMQNRTSLVIAHRLSTVQDANKICVLKQGSLVESGNHQELMALGGEYARFQRMGSLSVLQ